MRLLKKRRKYANFQDVNDIYTLHVHNINIERNDSDQPTRS